MATKKRRLVSLATLRKQKRLLRKIKKLAWAVERDSRGVRSPLLHTLEPERGDVMATVTVVAMPPPFVKMAGETAGDIRVLAAEIEELFT